MYFSRSVGGSQTSGASESPGRLLRLIAAPPLPSLLPPVELLTQWVWSRAGGRCALLTSAQVMLMLFVWGPHVKNSLVCLWIPESDEFKFRFWLSRVFFKSAPLF